MRPKSTTHWTCWLLVSIVLGLLPSVVKATEKIPLFDGHIHYNRDVWAIYPPETALAQLEKVGIEQALISSTPDEGTLKLYKLAPKRVIPILRPYRTPTDRQTWYQDPQILNYLKERLSLGMHQGIGEFHLYGGQAQTSQIKQLVEMAVEHDLFLHAHSDESAIEILINHNPKVRMLWAHGGMTSPPESIDRILSRYLNVWVELSYRYDDIVSSGDLEPAWRALFLKYPERFILGTDTWSADRWAEVDQIVDIARTWIALLPQEVQTKFAFENAAHFVGH